MTAPDSVIEIRDLKTQFGSLVVHEQLNLTIERGAIVALVGGSGCGKTTLLREIIMLTKPAAGSIRVFGREVVGTNRKHSQQLNRRFGVLFQKGALFTSLTIRENVAVPLLEHTRLDRNTINAIADLKIALAGLPAHAADNYPAELSGGMIKRAALARALALDPDLLFLDEPSAGLDPVSANALDELILQLKDSLGLTVVMVTHDLDSLWRVTDRVAFMGERKVIGYASMTELTQSEHPLIQEYLGGPRGRAVQAAQG
ncbi:MAG: ATP-binding cassette domain-containing protein [Candidatus Competibacteraceae bacterium]|nr:ATP-binding cassette domain-containing protein [Candidatus Competibacteraceae bacterium]